MAHHSANGCGIEETGLVIGRMVCERILGNSAGTDGLFARATHLVYKRLSYTKKFRAGSRIVYKRLYLKGNHPKEEATTWFIMKHLEMKRFKAWLEVENGKRLNQGLPIIESFFPHDFLKGDSSSPTDLRVRHQEEEVHQDFADLVFLRATKSEIHEIVNTPWNLAFSNRLRHYLDPERKHATVSDRMMQDFFEACLKYRGYFEVIPSIENIEAMDRVLIKSGPFAGHEASVVKVNHSKGTIHLELAIPMVSNIMTIRMEHVGRDQVAILDPGAADAIRTDFIEYTQSHLLTILEHRIKRIEDKEVNLRDAETLTRLFRYRNHHVENEAARNHFLALMLICAHLSHSSSERELRERALESLAAINRRSESKAATDTRTYLWIALYVSTHEPTYRDSAKQYVRDHQPKSGALRRFVTLIRTGRKI